ncbi:MAG: T9SS type A sorting domain-containing protein [Bacteroidetes bacterium]|nr:T9SS type A sorting domain-containing protein [Bacteroidota bacterium]
MFRNAFRIFPVLLLFAAGSLNAQYRLAFPNFRIFPSIVTQTEPIVCFNPNNRQMMFASAYTINTTNGFISEGVYVSTNGGYNWTGTDTCKGNNIFNHGGDPGVSIDKNGVFIITHIGSPNVVAGVYSHYSTDMGTTWSSAYALTTSQPEDKGSSATDGSSSSPYYGRTYASWVNYVNPFPVLVAYTTNSGATWTAPFAINSPPPQRCSGGYIRTGKDGTVYNAWAGVSSTSPFTENFAGFGFSTNGGANWTIVQNAYQMNGINGTLPAKGNIRVNGLPRYDIDKSGGPRNGWIYMITAEYNLSPAGTDPDIILHRSTNNGLNWSAGIRVNQDALNNGKIQYCPSVSVDSTGGVNVLFYDDRNTTSDSAEVFLARSQDGGNTWREFVVSEHRFKPKPIAGAVSSYQGDFITLESGGNNLYAYWMDDHSGIYQIWSAIINISTIGIRKTDTEVPADFSLSQNYPNPFNPTTNIKFAIPENGKSKIENGNVTLRVYDMLGKEVAALVNERLQPGTYEVQFDAGNILPSGTYIYRLSAGSFSESKKMILVK